MKKKGFIFLIMLMFIVLAGFIMFFLSRSLLQIKNIELVKNFELDKQKIIDYLGIYPIRPIWKYNTKSMEEKLSKQFFLQEYKVYKKYPNTLVVKIMMREPVANMVDKKGNIFAVDKEGVIFRKSINTDNIYPLLIYADRSKIKIGIEVAGKSKEVIETLRELKNKNKNVYNSISQIEIMPDNVYGQNYILNFRTSSQRLYIRNKIGIDPIIRALACVIYLNDRKFGYKRLLYTNTAFAVIN